MSENFKRERPDKILYFRLLRLNALKISIQKTDTNPTNILKPICAVEMDSNIKNFENKGTKSSKLVRRIVAPMMIKTKLFLYQMVVNIE